MRFLLLVATAVAMCLNTEALIDVCSTPKGMSGSGQTMGNILAELNSPLEKAELEKFKTLCFPTQSFSNSGKVKVWEVFAAVEGTVCILVMRPVGNSSIEYVGRNCFKVLPGFHTSVPSNSQRISVANGDFICASYYEDASHSGVYFEFRDPSDPTAFTPTKDLQPGKMLTLPYAVNDLTIGNIYPEVKHDYLGLVSLRGILFDTTDGLKLVSNASTAREGYAYMFKDNVWAPICDKWFDLFGWPRLFCQSMGFPDVESAVSAIASKRPTIDGPNHMMNIRCKASQNITIFSCDTHGIHLCNHTWDIYVKCKPKADLWNKKNGVGIPISYDCGEWGLICDEKTVDFHKSNREQSWVTAFCRDLGFKNFEKLQRATASEVQPLLDKGLKDSWKNPECDITAVSELKECRSAILTPRRCDGLYYKFGCVH